MNTGKKKSALILGIAALPFSIFIPAIGLILGLIGHWLANSFDKESPGNYNLDIKVNRLAIIWSITFWLFRIITSLN